MSNEADTCRTYILPKLHAAGWEDDYITERLVLTPGRIVSVGDKHIRREGLRPDYVLFIRRNIPIAVVEAKAEYKQAGDEEDLSSLERQIGELSRKYYLDGVV